MSSRIYLCLTSSLICTRESPDVVLNLPLVPQELNVCTIHQNPAFLLQFDVFIPLQRCESPILADNDLLAAWKLVRRSSQSFNSRSAMRITSSDGEEDLTDVDTSDSSVRLSPRATHTSLQSIGTSAGQHLVDSYDMVGVSANTEMKAFLSGNFDQVPAEK